MANSNIKKAMALILALSMCSGLISVPAMATDGDGENDTLNVTLSIEKEGTTVEVPMTDVDDPETPKKDNQNTVTVGPEAGTVLDRTGDLPDGPDDKNYNYKETIVKQQGSVTVTTEEIEFSEVIDTENTELEHVLSTTTPTEDNDLVYKEQAPEMYLPGYEDDVLAPEGSADDNYGFTYVGTGNTSKFMPSIVYTEPLDEEGKLAMYGENAYIKNNNITYYYVGWLTDEVKATIAKDENGKYVTDENGYILDKDGNRIFKEERTSVDPDGNTVYLHRFDNYNGSMYAEGWYEDGKWKAELNGDESFAAIWAGPQQFILVDDNGNLVTTYCADVTTPTQDNFGYNIENLEDADYYSEEEAALIRAIAFNGYWGTEGAETDSDGNIVYMKDADGNDILDADGNKVPAPKLGSLEAMKQMLLASGFSEEELASLNDGVALTATQMAIWSNSNKMSSIQFINSYYSNWGTGNVPADKEDEVELLFKLYTHLTNLDPVKTEGTTADTVITKDNFVDNLNVTVIKKEKGHDNNNDADDTNDAYVTNLTFALVVTPSTENGDDLVVKVVDSEGKVLAEGRVAGTNDEGENYQNLVADENGNYSFTNIVMTEGEQNFNLTLEGIQNLDKGVYLYSSEIVDETSSQTLVGVASGERAVNVSMNIKFDLDVDDQIVVTERHKKSPNKPTPPTPPVEPPVDPNEPPVDPEEPPLDIPEDPTPLDPVPPADPEIPDDIPTTDIPVEIPENIPTTDIPVEIPDETPLTDVPKTGDISALWYGLTLLSGGGLMGLLTGRKGKDEQ